MSTSPTTLGSADSLASGSAAHRPKTTSSGTEVKPISGAHAIVGVPVARLRQALDAISARALTDGEPLALILGSRSVILVMPGGNDLPAHQISLSSDRFWNVGPTIARRQLEAGPTYAVAAFQAFVATFAAEDGRDVLTGSRDANNAITLGTSVLQPLAS